MVLPQSLATGFRGTSSSSWRPRWRGPSIPHPTPGCLAAPAPRHCPARHAMADAARTDGVAAACAVPPRRIQSALRRHAWTAFCDYTHVFTLLLEKLRYLGVNPAHLSICHSRPACTGLLGTTRPPWYDMGPGLESSCSQRRAPPASSCGYPRLDTPRQLLVTLTLARRVLDGLMTGWPLRHLLSGPLHLSCGGSRALHHRPRAPPPARRCG